jgi:AcrR family transcriptional regulator
MQKRGQGRECLLEAARLEFEEFGFDGTNTNAIAKRAGYAPQTFYRHFPDKTAIFLAVYQSWAIFEMRSVLEAKAADEIANLLLNHHRAYRRFRRSLRTLTVTNQSVAQARAQSRLKQINAYAAKLGSTDSAWILSMILKVERLCDAIVDGEFEACGIEFEAARQQLIATLSAQPSTAD